MYAPPKLPNPTAALLLPPDVPELPAPGWYEAAAAAVWLYWLLVLLLYPP